MVAGGGGNDRRPDGRRRQRQRPAPARRHRRDRRPAALAASPSPSASGPSLFERARPRPGARSGRRRCGTIPPLPGRRAGRRSKAAATSASRPAPTIPRSPSTRSATWPGSVAARSSMRWSQLGFGRTSTTSRSQDTPRNLMGFKDGTANIRAEDTDAMRRFVWLGAGDGPAWMRGGSYMVTRRIRMLLEVWDRSSLEDQEQTIGRHKYSGAPLGRRATSSTRSTSTPNGDGKPRSRPTPTSASPRPRSTAASGSCAAATPSPTASTSASASSKPASSSSASSATRDASSSRSSAGSAPPTRSTSTSSTSAAPSSRSRPGPERGGYVGETLLG